MPTGTPNFLAATLVLALKLALLPRITQPAFFCYLTASVFTTTCYILGWQSMEAAWLPTVSVLGILAAVECTHWALGLQSEEERNAVSKWCVLLAMVLVTVAMIDKPITYPKYPTLVYEIRLYGALFAVGYLAALMGYCFAVGVGVPRYVWHGAILLVRLATMGALLLVPHEYWLEGDLVGGAINVVTLGAWFWLIPARAGIAKHKTAS